MSITTDMAGEWLFEVGDTAERSAARRAELLGAGTYLVRQLLAEIADLREQVAELRDATVGAQAIQLAPEWSPRWQLSGPASVQHHQEGGTDGRAE